MNKKKNPFRIFWLILGLLCLGMGTVGIVLPILPTVPFFLSGAVRLYQKFTEAP